MKRFLLIVLALIGLGSIIAATLFVTQAQYAIYDGEAVVEVNGRFATPRDLLTAANISTRPEDIVSPPLDEPIEPGTAVRIQRAQQISVRTGDANRSYWTHQQTLGAFLAEASISIQPTTQIFADGRAVAQQTLFETALPSSVEIGRFLTVTIVDNGQQQLLNTAAQTVGEALQEASIVLYAADSVEPAMSHWLEPDLTITVLRSMPITIEADGRTVQTRSSHTNPLAVLAEAGILLNGADYTRPSADTALQAGNTIHVIRVTEDFRLEDEPIPFQTLWQATPDLDLDSRGLIQSGEPGVRRQRIRIRYENGVEVSQTPDGEWIAREPADEIIGYGTRINLGTVNTPEGPRQYWRVVRMRVTSYTAASSGKAADDPAYGITASGRYLETGIVAIDRSVVPFRSSVYVPGYGIGYAGDTGGGVKGRWIDLGYSEGEYVSWSGYVDVYYLTPVPAPEDINYLLPSVLP
ncbi:MAG: ubiquitin-like domain-containing protein [Chloroflexota bacterium]